MGHLLPSIAMMLIAILAMLTFDSGFANAAALPILPGGGGCKRVNGWLHCPGDTVTPPSNGPDFEPMVHGTEASSDSPVPTTISATNDSPVVIPRGLADPVCTTSDLTIASHVLEQDAIDDFCEGSNLQDLTDGHSWIYKNYTIENINVQVKAELTDGTDQVWLEEGICKDAFIALLNGCLPGDLSSDEHGGAIVDNDAVIYSITLTADALKLRSTTEESAAVRIPSPVASPLVALQGRNTYDSTYCHKDEVLIPRDDIEKITNNYCRTAARTLNKDVFNFITYGTDNVFVKVSALYKGDGTASIDEGACNGALSGMLQQCEVNGNSDGGWTHDSTSNIWYYVVTWSGSARTRDVVALSSDISTIEARANGYGTPTCTPGAIISKTDLDTNAVRDFCTEAHGVNLTPQLGSVERSYNINNLPVRIRATSMNGHQTFLDKGQCIRAINHMLDTCDNGGAGAVNKYDVMYQVFIDSAPALLARGNGLSTPNCYTSTRSVSKGDLDGSAVQPFCHSMSQFKLTTDVAHPEYSFTVDGCPVRIRANRLNLRDSVIDAGECESTIDAMLTTCTQGQGGEIAQGNVGYMVFVG